MARAVKGLAASEEAVGGRTPATGDVLQRSPELSDVSVAEDDDIEEPQPPREMTSDPVMSDPPEVGGAPPNATRSVEKSPPKTSAENGSRRGPREVKESARNSETEPWDGKASRKAERLHKASGVDGGTE